MEQLNRILALTEAVEQHVARGAWSSAGTLDAERRLLLAELCEDPGPAADAQACRQVLQQLLVRNHQMLERLQHERRQLQASAALGDRALRAYESNGSTVAGRPGDEGARGS